MQFSIVVDTPDPEKALEMLESTIEHLRGDMKDDFDGIMALLALGKDVQIQTQHRWELLESGETLEWNEILGVLTRES